MFQQIQTLTFWTGVVCWLLVLLPAGLIWWNRRTLLKVSLLLKSKKRHRAPNPDHEVDLSFNQPFGLLRVLGASVVIAFLAYVLLYYVTFGAARWHFASRVNITKAFVQKVVNLGTNSALGRFKDDFQPVGKTSEPFKHFLTLLSDDKDLGAASPNVLNCLKSFMQVEEKTNALSAFVALLLGQDSFQGNPTRHEI